MYVLYDWMIGERDSIYHISMDALQNRALNTTKIIGGDGELFQGFNKIIYNQYHWLEYNKTYTNFSIIKTHTPLHLSLSLSL